MRTTTLKCKRCDGGYMYYTGDILTQADDGNINAVSECNHSVTQFQHECSYCGVKEAILGTMYPKFNYEDREEVDVI